MEGLVILVALGLVGVVILLPIASFVRSGRALRENEELRLRRESRMNLRHLNLIAAVGLCLLTGCATGDYPSLTCHVWRSGWFSSFNEPSTNANARFWASTERGDVLVTYDEARETDEKIRRRAFYVRANLERLNTRRKPRFVNLKSSRGLEPLVLLTTSPSAEWRATNRSSWVRFSADGQLFSVVDVVAGDQMEFVLPTYETATGPTLRLLATPLAVAADTAVVGFALGYFVLLGMASSHSTFAP